MLFMRTKTRILQAEIKK